MKKVVIYYNSHKGTTKYFGEEIQEFLSHNNTDAFIYSIDDFNYDQLNNADIVLLGAWTNGLFFFLQHPEKKWVDFAKNLPALSDKKIGFFTTYKVATGSMFNRMAVTLKGKINTIDLTLKSKSYTLTEEHKKLLHEFIK
jgi:flavodoxin